MYLPRSREGKLAIGLISIVWGTWLLLFGKKKLEKDGRRGKVYSDGDIVRTRRSGWFLIGLGLLIVVLCALWWDSLK